MDFSNALFRLKMKPTEKQVTLKILTLNQMRFQRWEGLSLSLLLLCGFITVLLIGGSGCTDRLEEDDKPKDPLVVRNSCPVLPHPSEAEILADRILRLESDDLLFDPKEREARIEEIERILRVIRGTYPEIENIPVRGTRALGQLRLGLESGLYQTLAEILTTDEDFITLKTGNAEFDALTTTLELQGIVLNSPKSIFTRASLCFKEWVNTDAASDAYLAVEGVRSATPAYTAGDGPDIVALKERERWFFIFRDAWGDCPSGCGYQELFFFTVVGDEVEQIAAETSSTMLPFQKLLSTRRSWERA